MFAATIDGTRYVLEHNLTATRSSVPGVAAFVTVRGANGATTPLRDLEVRFEHRVGTSACTMSMLSVASAVLRTSDRGAFETQGAMTSCTYQVTAVSAGRGERVRGTFTATVRSSAGATAAITDGVFDVPTIN